MDECCVLKAADGRHALLILVVFDATILAVDMDKPCNTHDNHTIILIENEDSGHGTPVLSWPSPARCF